MNICVQTSPGRRGEAKPRVFFLGPRRLIVVGILDSWVDQAHYYYEVLCEDGRCFVLRYDSSRQAWELAGVFACQAPKAKPQAKPAAEPAVPARRWWSAFSARW